jgi:uncharacterized protein
LEQLAEGDVMAMGFRALILCRSKHPQMSNYAAGESLAEEVVERLEKKMAVANGRFEDLNSNEQYILGQCYHRELGCQGNSRKAFKLSRICAESGNPLGQNAVGTFLEHNPCERFHWFRKSAQQGLSFGQYHVARCFQYGDGVDRCLAEAVDWYRAAAEQGLRVAQQELGDCYANGHGIQKHRPEAKKWYQLAAKQGDCYSRDQIAILERQRR